MVDNTKKKKKLKIIKKWKKKQKKKKKKSRRSHKKKLHIPWSSSCGTAKMNPTRNREVSGSIPGLAQWVKDLPLP